MPSIDLKYALALLLLACCCAGVAQAGSPAKLDINKAGAAQLAQNLTGVGPKKALAIVEYRKLHGLFKSVDELAKVKGIGAKTVEKNRSKLFAGQPATTRAEAGKLTP